MRSTPDQLPPQPITREEAREQVRQKFLSFSKASVYNPGQFREQYDQLASAITSYCGQYPDPYDWGGLGDYIHILYDSSVNDSKKVDLPKQTRQQLAELYLARLFTVYKGSPQSPFAERVARQEKWPKDKLKEIAESVKRYRRKS